MGGLVAECVARRVVVVGAGVLGAAVPGAAELVAGAAGVAAVSGSARGAAELHAATVATKATAIVALIR
jgi:hypothetical protein